MSAWYDPGSWELFSDWGAAAWSEDLEAAVSQAEDWIERTAIAQDWSEGVLKEAVAHVATAANAGDVGTFWNALASNFAMAPASSRNAPGWTKLITTFESAATAAGSVAAGRAEGSVSSVVGGALEASADDAIDMATFAKEYGPYIILAILLLGAIAFGVTKAMK